MWRWSNAKEWRQHHSHEGFYKQPTAGPLSLTKPSLVRRVAAEVQGIGWEKSRDVERRFKSCIDMVLATDKEWMEIPGVGPTIAQRAVKSFAGQEED
jgi:ERCC4-type nuclease